MVTTVGLWLMVAAATHLLAVWALPRVIMWRLSSSAAPTERSGVFLPPVTDADQRRVVMPSPDLLYATCGFDLSQRPLRIRADPKTPHYWSIALYASNSDNFFVWNDRQAAGAPPDILLVGPQAEASARSEAPTARVVQAPTPRGLLLMRVLVGNSPDDLALGEAARRTLRCDAL